MLQLLNPEPATWSGKTEELDWSVSVGSLTFSPSEFSTVFIKAALHDRNDLGANPTVATPTTHAAAVRSSSKRLAPAPFIKRATFSLLEEAYVQAYQVAHTPISASTAPKRGGFDLRLRRKSDDRTLIERDVGGGLVEIMKIEIDGENLEHGHELKLQLPPMSPALPTPGSKMSGRALFDRRMSTGETSGHADTSVQINPSGNWGKIHRLMNMLPRSDGLLWYQIL